MKDEDLLRYSRHILLPEIDLAGQESISDSHVLIIGMGGLGSPIALYLAAAGFGKITICDDDEVDLSNLQRQIAHSTQDIGKPKVASAAETMHAINPRIDITQVSTRIDSRDIEGLVEQVDLVVDATDNFASRLLINRACIQNKTPAVFGAAVRLEGQIFVYDPRLPDAPCYECLHPSVSDSALNCAENGVAGPVVGVIGSMEALEAIRLVCGIGKSSAGSLQTFDARDMQWHRFKVLKRNECAACGASQDLSE